jgi:hypothetical protein
MEEDDGLDLIAFCSLFQGFLCKIIRLSCNFLFLEGLFIIVSPLMSTKAVSLYRGLPDPHH